MGDEPDLRRYRGIPLLFAPGDGNQSDQEALVPLLARYRQGLELGEVVVLDGASYSQENLGALQGFSWVMRVPATLKEARALLREELPQEAWRPLLPGYRGLEVESEYGVCGSAGCWWRARSGPGWRKRASGSG